MKRIRRVSIYLMSFGCLLTGLVIYLIFRPKTLLMFHWADLFGITGSIGIIRTWADDFGRYLPSWVIYSLPFALWVTSYLFFIEGIWMNSLSLARHVWFWCIPVVAITAEVAQITHIIPGFFDTGDLLALVLATIFGFFATQFNQINKGVIEL